MAIKIIVVLSQIIAHQHEADVIRPVYIFVRDNPVPTGTIFVFEGKEYGHAYDVATPDGDLQIVYVEVRHEKIERE